MDCIAIRLVTSTAATAAEKMLEVVTSADLNARGLPIACGILEYLARTADSSIAPFVEKSMILRQFLSCDANRFAFRTVDVSTSLRTRGWSYLYRSQL